jgi:hypothetical protein
MATYKSILKLVGKIDGMVFQKNGVVKRLPKTTKIVSEKVKSKNLSFGKASGLSARVWGVIKAYVKKKQNSHSLLTSVLQKCYDVVHYQWDRVLLVQTLRGYSFLNPHQKMDAYFISLLKEVNCEIIVIEVFISWENEVKELKRIEKMLKKEEVVVFLNELLSENELVVEEKGVFLRYLIVRNDIEVGAWILECC